MGARPQPAGGSEPGRGVRKTSRPLWLGSWAASCVMDTEGEARAQLRPAARRLTMPMALASIRPTTASGWCLAVAFADHLARRSAMSASPARRSATPGPPSIAGYYVFVVKPTPSQLVA